MTLEQRIEDLESENRQLRGELEKYSLAKADPEARKITDTDIIGQIEYALRTSELKFEIAFNTSPGLMFKNKLDNGQYTEVNKSWCMLTGFLRHEMIGHSPVELGIVSKETWMDIMGELKKKGSIYQQDIQINAKNGEAKEMIYSAEIIEISGIRYILASGIDVTRRRKAEAELTRALELLKSITDGTDDMIAAQDVDFNYLFFNPAYSREFRKLWARDLVPGTNMVEALAPWPQEQQRARELWDRALKGETFDVKLEFGPAEDKYFYDLHFNPLVDSKGKIFGAAHTMRDITRQKEIQEAVSRSENLLKKILEVLPVGVFVSDENGNIAQTNSAAEKIWGGAKHVPIDRFNEYRGWWRNTGERILADQWAFARAFTKGETSVNEEIDIECFDGSRKTILNSAAPVVNEQGKVISAVAVIMDITKRIQAEKALRESEELFRTLADNISQLAWIADEKGLRFWYNKRWFNYTGTTLGEMQGWGWKNVIHPDHVDKVVSGVQDSWNTGETWEDTVPIRGKDGGYRWFLSRALPIRDEKGKIVLWFGTNTDITEQRKSAEEVKNANAIMEAFFESSPGMLHILDKDLKYLNADNTTAGLYGMEREELIGKSIHQVSPGNVQLYKQMLENVTIQERGCFNLEIKAPGPGGKDEYIILKTFYFPVPLTDDTQGIGVVGIDITDLRKTQELLSRERELLQTLIDGIPVVITIFSSDIRDIQSNRAFKDITGWPGENSRKKNIMELVFPDPRYRKEVSDYMLSPEPGFRDIIMTARDGAEIELYWANVKLDDERYVGIGIDISERKRMEEKLRNQAMMLDQVQDAIVGLDSQGHIRYMNDTAYRMYEIERDSEILGTKIWDHYLIHWDHMSAEENMYKMLAEQGTWKGENIHVTAQGRQLWVESVVSAIKDPERNITGIISAMRDITERKKLQEELQKRMAEQQNISELFENLLYIAAHDLKGPIANMYLALNLMDRIEDAGQKIQNIGYFKPLVNRLENTINGLTSILQVHKIDQSSAKEIFFESLINEIMLGHRETLYEGALQYDFTEKPSIIYIEPFLSSIMSNLINNAIKYSRETVPLKVEVTSKRADEGFTLLTVRDNGIGIDLEQYGGLLFSPFKRITPAKAEGTGVGLYIIKNIIEKNGGYIKMESTPGEGTVFFCYLREYGVSEQK
jgi:PAS domain S-box-containing protein